MDYTTSKAFVIGVGIFLTLTIVGSFILVLSVVSDVYSLTENTDTSIAAQFDNLYSMYAGAELNALNLMNTLRKYETDTIVRVGVKLNGYEEIYYSESNKKLLEEMEDKIAKNVLSYEKMFNVSVIEDGTYIRLVFTIK